MQIPGLDIQDFERGMGGGGGGLNGSGCTLHGMSSFLPIELKQKYYSCLKCIFTQKKGVKP